MVCLPDSHDRYALAEEVARPSTEVRRHELDQRIVIVEPDQSPQAVEDAQRLAEIVCVELMSRQELDSVDAVMAARRGRAWLP